MTPALNMILASLLCVASTMHTLSLQGQESLSKNAHSIVLDSRTEIVCKSSRKAVRKEIRHLLILNGKGANNANFYCFCDMFNSLQNFSGEILNAKGEVIRKIKKSELKKNEFSSELSSDDYYYYYECNVANYPFTVKYEWEMKCNDGLITYPTFAPQENFHQAVSQASYRIELPPGESARYRVMNDQDAVKIEQGNTPKGEVVLKASVSKLPAIAPEPFSLPRNKLFPHVYFAPNQFEYGDTRGKSNTWKEYGAWQYSLLNGRDVLPESFRKELRDKVAQCTTDREKVKTLYDYLASSTRYVSIQLGIGGLQPFAASEVCRSGFGDCKGLSNYMRAMLKEVGIPSRYTIINTYSREVLRDFASANQMNHVILQVPLPQDTLWLECTNPHLPFGYVHSSIAGHHAVLITESGGEFCQLPTYRDSTNTQCISATVSLLADGRARIQTEETSRLFQYESRAGIASLEVNKQKEWLRNGLSLPHADIGSIRISDEKKAEPSINIRYTIDSEQYANRTGNRLFVPVNIFRKEFYSPTSASRDKEIYIEHGRLDTDRICLTLPEAYSIEGVPRPVDIQTKFGSFHASIKVKGKELHLLHRFYLLRGIYPASDNEAFTRFLRQVAEQYYEKIILKKKERQT